MQAAKPKVDYLNRNKLAWLLASQCCIILPLLFYLPSWLWAVWGLVALWRVQMYLGRWPAPGFLIKGLVVGLCALGIYISFAGHTGTETMVSLLLSAFVLKLLEVKSYRDAQLLIFIGFITNATQLLFNQTPLAALYNLACAWLLISAWRGLHLSNTQPLGQSLKRSGAILLHAFPIMLVMFVVIPRLSPLWAIPNQKIAKTGFTDSLSPGDLGDLVQSKEPAFRVSFSGPPPQAASLYWRGIVMDSFDGRRWRLSQSWSGNPVAPVKIDKSTPTIDYSIILEPHGQHWLFALMTPTSLQASTLKAWITDNQLLMTQLPVTQRLSYTVRTALTSTANNPATLNTLEERINLNFPAQLNPRTQTLAQEWRAQARQTPNPELQIIQTALAYYHRDFTYTLKPPPLGQHSVDDFLFVTKRGFCEHFASSFALLMRAAKIPARVVVGYQGGRWNPVENYLLVSQSDAHAWVEVWTPERGWWRIDPTASVAPNRIEQGIDEALSDEDMSLIQGQWQQSAFLLSLQQHWDAAGYAWQRWVLSYNDETQQGLLARWLGGREPWRLTLWLLGLGLTGAGLFALYMRQRQALPPERPETQWVRKLERKLSARGHARPAHQTLREYANSITEPRLHAQLLHVCDAYEAIAYRQRAEALPLLIAAIKKI